MWIRDTKYIKQSHIVLQGVNTSKRTLSQVKNLVVHHSASDLDSWLSINDYHRAKFKQGGLTYHFGIGRSGDITQFRSLHDISHHVAQNNTYSIGVCVLGDFTNDMPSSEQLSGLDILIKHVKLIFPLIEVKAHSSLRATICPGLLSQYLVKYKLSSNE